MGWYEGPVDVFIHGLLIDLRDTVWSLKSERMELKAALADAVVKMEKQKKEISELKAANEALNAANKAMSQTSVKRSLWMCGLVVPFAAVAVFMRLG